MSGFRLAEWKLARARRRALAAGLGALVVAAAVAVGASYGRDAPGVIAVVPGHRAGADEAQPAVVGRAEAPGSDGYQSGGGAIVVAQSPPDVSDISPEEAARIVPMLTDYVVQSFQRIAALEAQVQALVSEIREGNLSERIAELEAQVQVLFDDIEFNLQRKNWTLLDSNNLRDVVSNDTSDQIIYEYAVLRNGGFRRLTASNWNAGWLVMTEPYFTGDQVDGLPGLQAQNQLQGRLLLGGSLWIWDTSDPADDACASHLH